MNLCYMFTYIYMYVYEIRREVTGNSRRRVVSSSKPSGININNQYYLLLLECKYNIIFSLLVYQNLFKNKINKKLIVLKKDIN